MAAVPADAMKPDAAGDAALPTELAGPGPQGVEETRLAVAAFEPSEELLTALLRRIPLSSWLQTPLSEESPSLAHGLVRTGRLADWELAVVSESEAG